MDKKDKPLEDILEQYNKYKENEIDKGWDCFLALALINNLFGSGFGSVDYKYNDLDKRLAKLEAKQEIIEKIMF